MPRMTRDERMRIYENILKSGDDVTVLGSMVDQLRGDDEEMEREINDRTRERDGYREDIERLTEAGETWKGRYETLREKYTTMFLRGTDEAMREQRDDIRNDDVEDNVEWTNLF
jgi:chromosome segregation ATPase